MEERKFPMEVYLKESRAVYNECMGIRLGTHLMGDTIFRCERLLEHSQDENLKKDVLELKYAIMRLMAGFTRENSKHNPKFYWFTKRTTDEFIER